MASSEENLRYRHNHAQAGPLHAATVSYREGHAVPTGRVKFYDTEKGFGFLASDEGEDVFVHASALPTGVDALKPGSKVDFGIVDGKRGKQALSVQILEEAPSISKAMRKPAEDMAPVVEDLIKLLDNVSNSLRRGRYPDDQKSKAIAKVMRAVANDLDA
ncbi:MAG: cold-shock protein [Candidatus Nanopelagicales bacterium]